MSHETPAPRCPSARWRERVALLLVVLWFVGPYLVVTGALTAGDFMGIPPEPDERGRGLAMLWGGFLLTAGGPILAASWTSSRGVRVAAAVELAVTCVLALATYGD